MSSTEMIIPFRIIFLQLRHGFCGINFCDVGTLWKKCGIYFRDPNVLTNPFQPSLKKEDKDIYGNNLYVFLIKKSTLQKYLHHVVVYVE